MIVGLDHMPRGVLFWRGLLTWIGGVGVGAGDDVGGAGVVEAGDVAVVAHGEGEDWSERTGVIDVEGTGEGRGEGLRLRAKGWRERMMAGW